MKIIFKKESIIDKRKKIVWKFDNEQAYTLYFAKVGSPHSYQSKNSYDWIRFFGKKVV